MLSRCDYLLTGMLLSIEQKAVDCDARHATMSATAHYLCELF